MSIRASQTLQTTINFTFTEGGETLDIAGLSLGFEVRGATAFGMSATGDTGEAFTIIPDGGLSTLDPAVYDGIVEVQGYSPVFVPVSVEKVNTNYVNNVTISYEPTAFDTTTAAPSEFVQSWNGEAGVVDFSEYVSTVNGASGAVEVAESNQVTLNYEVNNLGIGDPIPETIGAMSIKESLDKLYFYKIDSNNKDLRATFVQNSLTSGRITLSQKGNFAEWTYTTSSYNAGDGIWTVDYDYTNGATFDTGDAVSVQIFPDNTSFAGVSGEYDYLKVNQYIEFGDGTTQGSASTGSGSGEVESVNGLTGAVTLNAGTNMTITSGVGGITLDAAGGGGGETAERIEQDIQADAKVFANDPVYITGSVGASGRLTVARADASDPTKMPAAGIVTETIENGVNGTMIILGSATGLNTSAFDTGDVVYVASGAGLTNVKPTGATDLIQNMGKVGRDDNTTGEILITGAGRANDVPNLIHARAGISSDAGITSSGDISALGGNVYVGSHLITQNGSNLQLSPSGSMKFSVSGSQIGAFSPFLSQLLLTANSGITLGNGITFPDGTFQSSAATTSASGVDSLNGLTGPVTINAGTNMTVTNGVGGITLDAAGGGGGTASTDWIMDPSNTGTWRLFDDLIGDEPRIAAVWNSGMQLQPWSYWANADDGDIIGGYRILSSPATTDYDRAGFSFPKLAKSTPADGDEFLVELRVKIVFGNDADTAPFFSFGVQKGDAGSQDSIGPVYGNDPRAGIHVTIGGTEWKSYISDSTNNQSPTIAAISPSVSFTEAGTYRLAVHATYDSAGSGWDMNWYIDGTQVHSSTLTAGTGSPFVRTNLADNSEGPTSANERYVEYDWLLIQYTRPSTVSYLDIDNL